MSQSVTFNLALQVTISIGEPKIINNMRQCARCVSAYKETANVWPTYPMCPSCVEEVQYEQELEQNRLERERAIVRNQKLESHWKREGF